MTTARAYFERQDERSFVATEHTSGAWDVAEQHVGPSLGLLVHLVEADRDARGRSDLVVGRLSFDILGTMPVGQVTTSVEVVRPGRTIELVEATLTAAGRETVRLRAWLLQAGDTASVAGNAHPRLPPPEELPAWAPTSVWPGGFLASAQVRRAEVEPGRARYWVRTDVRLLTDEPVSRLAAAAGLVDIANGITVRISPRCAGVPERRPDRPPVPRAARRLARVRHHGVLRLRRPRRHEQRAPRRGRTLRRPRPGPHPAPAACLWMTEVTAQARTARRPARRSRSATRSARPCRAGRRGRSPARDR